MLNELTCAEMIRLPQGRDWVSAWAIAYLLSLPTLSLLSFPLKGSGAGPELHVVMI